MKIKMKKCVGVSCVWLKLEKKKRIKKIKVKKCVGVGCVAKCAERKVEKEKKRNGMFWNESGQNDSSLVKKKSIKKSQR